MTLAKPKFRPGINKTDTLLQNEGGYSDGNRVRFYQGQPQPIGGWSAYNATQYDGRVRGSHAWTNLQSQSCLAFATEQKLYGGVDGTINDITPFQHFTVLNNALSTTNGSAIVTIAMTSHGLVAGQTVSISNQQEAVGGLTLSGNYTVTAVVTPNSFTVTAGSNASSDASNAGKGIDITATLPTGAVDSTAGSTQARVSSLDNFGENLIYNPSGYTIFEYQPESAYPDLAVNGTFATSASWATTGGFNVTAGAAAKTVGTAGNLSQNIAGLDLSGRMCIVRFTVTVSAVGELRFKVNAGAIPAVISVGTASTLIEKSGTYERIFRMPADAVDIVFEAASNLGATIDNVSYGLYSKAYPITTAPTRVDQAFVDPRGVIVAVGCTQTDGTYAANAVRNCDVNNAALWIPDTDNVASELLLRGGGGQLMAGCATRQQSLVWGDDGMFSLQWLGQAGAAFTPNLLATNCGLLSRHSFVKANAFVLFASNTRDFWIFEGVNDNTQGLPKKIPSPLRDDFFDNFDFEQALKCHGGLNPAWTEAWFWSPDTRDVSGGAAGECSRYVAFNWVENAWHCGSLARTSWIPSGVVDEPLAFEPAASNKTLIYKHETGKTAAGSALGAWLKTSDLDIEDGDKLGTVTAIVPDFAQQSGNIDFTIYSKPFPNGSTITKGPYTATPTTQRLPVRVLGRQLSMRLDWTTSGGFGRLGALRVDLNQTGAKR